MFSRYRVRSNSEMIADIKLFLSIACGLSSSSSDIKIFTKDNNHILWFLEEDFGISAWITDASDVNVDGTPVTNSPYFATSTVGLAAKYVTDAQVTVIDDEETNKAKDRAREDFETWETNTYGSKPITFNSARDKVVYEQEVADRLRSIDSIVITKKKWERLYDTNVFHVGGALRYSDVPLIDGYKILDCHYNDGVFAFFLFSINDKKTTSSLIIGEYIPSSNNTDRCFILSNTFYIISEDKLPGYNDSFLYKSIFGNETFKLRGESRVIHYNNDLLRLVQYDVDYEPNPKKYSVNGVKVGFRQNICTLHLQVWNMSKADGDSESMYSGNNMKILEWYYRELHCSYECEEYNVGVNYYPLMDTNKKPYKVYDPYISGTDPFDEFTGFSRCGTGGNSVNTNNNISEIMPIIFYVLRDPDNLDSWSYIGHTNIINYVNMYNMSSGRFTQSKFRDNYEAFACYDLYRRRCSFTPWSDDENEKNPGHLYNEAWGFGGFPGLAFKLDGENVSNAFAVGRGVSIV